MKLPIKYTTQLLNGLMISSDQESFSNLPSIPIVSITINLPHGKIIKMEGFNYYLIIKTQYETVNSGQRVEESINFLGLKSSENCQISYHRFGQIFQCKNKETEWKPLIVKTFPKRDKTEKKRYTVEFGLPQSININKWHNGVWSPKATVGVA